MQNTGLLLRAITALTLMAVFFTLALVTAAALLFGAWEVGQAALTIRGRGVIFAFLIAAGLGVSGLVVLWSLIPRIDRFVPPGPELDEASQPALFEEIRRIAALTQQAPPSHVYLVPDVNAFVTERGGWMGIGSKRVMGLGLGLMSILNVSQLRAVIAHEFGHFHGGDTRLGPWIYKTRAAIIRTVQNLYRAGEAASEIATISWILVIVGKPFEWFAKGYLRITHAISRAQEYSADKVAIRTQGAQALIDGLKRTHQGGVAFGPFMDGELLPVLQHRRQPPMSEGFQRFLGAPAITTALQALEETELREGKQDPYDTHPPLRERVRHAESLAGQSPSTKEDERPALALLADVPGLEAKLCSAFVEENADALTPIGWDESVTLFSAGWREIRVAVGAVTGRATVAELPIATPDLRRLASSILGQSVEDVDETELRQWAAGRYADALSALLVENGFTASASPGEPYQFRRGGQTIAPFPLVTAYLAKELSLDAWVSAWREVGLQDAPLGTRAAAPDVTAA